MVYILPTDADTITSIALSKTSLMVIRLIYDTSLVMWSYTTCKNGVFISLKTQNMSTKLRI